MSDDAAFIDLGFARVDVDRRRRTGFPEVIFGPGKTPAEVAQIARVILEREPVLLATRISRAQFDAVQAEFPAAIFHERALPNDRARAAPKAEIADWRRGRGHG
jgi:pyridinium-3,5-biscarboxylic acid mononucleotide synthase